MATRVLIAFVLIITVINLTHSHSSKSGQTANSKQKRGAVQRTTVLILGGGMAGVSAANTLQAAGIRDFVLLEATGRIGGRVRDTNFYGRTIEEGANWIHGVEKNNNPLIKLAQEAQLKYYITTSTDWVRAKDSKGKSATNDTRKALREIKKAETLTYEKADELEIDSERLVLASQPADKAALRTSLRDSSLKEAMATLGGWKARTPAEFTAEYFQIDFVESKPPNEVSLVGNMNNYDEKYGEEEAFIVDPEGFVKVVRYLAARTFTANDPRLRFNEMVTEVNYAPASSEGVYVKTASGNEYYARFAIITFSNAVLLSGNVKFQPPLPEWKARALRQCQTVVYDKIFVKFADNVTPFWGRSEWMLFVDSEPATPQTAAGASLRSRAVQTALNRGEAYTRGYFTVWMNLTNEKILPNSNMLMVVLVDELAKAAEQKSDAELKSEITKVLRQMYGPTTPEPVGVYCTKWASNPLALGSFHSLRIGTTPADVDNLKRRLNNLYFAGDGSDAAFDGLLQGALITGQKKAQSIIKKINNPDS